MKKYFLSAVILLLAFQVNGQFQITNGARFISNGPAVLVLQDMPLINNGTMTPGNGSVKFTGSVPTAISGVPGTVFNELVMAKTGNTTVSLQTGIQVTTRVLFQSGLLELNQQELSLAPGALLENESAQSRITGSNGGVVTITLPMNAPAAANPGNLGAVISSPANLGIVEIRRGHKAQAGTGLSGSMHRYYDITPGNNAGLNAVLRLRYFDPELNGQAENALTLYKSGDAGQSWTNESFLLRNAADNYVEQGNISSFSRWTLSSFATTLPVTGLEFTAQRSGVQKVMLRWKTSQEMNNKGFSLQRRKEHETDFTTIRYISSQAPGGNSDLPLFYEAIDTNAYKGISYYRVQQEDFDGKTSYSPVRFITGTDAKTASLTIWPVPSAGNITILAAGVEKDMIRVFDYSGRLIRQAAITGGTGVTITNLPKGLFIIGLAGKPELRQQVVVQ